MNSKMIFATTATLFKRATSNIRCFSIVHNKTLMYSSPSASYSSGSSFSNNGQQVTSQVSYAGSTHGDESHSGEHKSTSSHGRMNHRHNHKKQNKRVFKQYDTIIDFSG